MRVQKRSPWLAGLAMGLAGLALFVGKAAADVTTDRGGSVIIFPKVIADEERDTLISISNTSNMPVMAHCAYVQGAGFCRISGDLCQIDADCEEIDGADNGCEKTWAKLDFDVWLTMKQPTMWRVSTGRRFDPSASFDRWLSPEERARCEKQMGYGGAEEPEGANGIDSNALVCPGFFFTSQEEFEDGEGGVVLPPPGSPNFQGELKCVQVAGDGSLNGGDALKGTATILTRGSTQISRYNSINIQAEDAAQNPTVVRLNGEEYNACPEGVEMTHFSTDGGNFVAENLDEVCGPGGCPVRTELTFIPCTQVLAGELVDDPINTVVQLLIYDEFETRASSNLQVQCWANLDLEQIADGFGYDGSTLKKTKAFTEQDTICIRGSANRGITCDSDAECGDGGVCGPRPGVLALVEQFYEIGAPVSPDNGRTAATAAANAFFVNIDSDDDLDRVGHCRGNVSQTCSSDAECGATGLCRINSATSCDSDSDCVALTAGDVCDRCMNDEIFLAEPGF